MSALGDLERTLTRAVEAGAAADPARVAAAERRRRRVRLRLPRRPWHTFIAILFAGGVTTGALGATGVLRIEKAERFPMAILPDTGAGVATSPLRILPLRVADPDGGPPWVIRTFTTSRKASCAQAGQLYRGQFGAVDYDRHGHKIFRLRAPTLPGYNTACSSLRDGVPVIPGQGNVMFVSTTPNCVGGQATGEPCPIRAERILRWGMIGSQATTATFVRPDGTRTAPQKIEPGTGGAYLFMESIAPGPAQRWADGLGADRREVDRRYPRVAYGSIPKAERPAADRRWKARIRFVQRLSRAHRAERQRQTRAIFQSDAVDATFADGTTQRVSGRGDQVSIAGIPGVPPVDDGAPASIAAGVHVKYQGVHRPIRVSFRAPVALDRFSNSYVVTVRGPTSPTCGDHPDSATRFTYRAPAVGRVVRVNVIAAYVTLNDQGHTVFRGGRPRRHHAYGWCTGRTYTARVAFHQGSDGGPGARRPVGQATFIAR